MKSKSLFWLLATVLLTTALPAMAQQTGKIFRIGFLDNSTASGSAVLVDAFRRELTKLGWIDGKNIAVEYRFAEGRRERVPELATDLVRLKVDLIVVTGVRSAFAAKKATTIIPIVFASAPDPVGLGMVASLARPGGNVTGLSGLSPEAKYQKARGTQGRNPQTLTSWTSPVAGRHSNRHWQPNERARAGGSGTQARIGGDRDST
jgi:putative tryptophan/tyrosine transport system substrate-binding protein